MKLVQNWKVKAASGSIMNAAIHIAGDNSCVSVRDVEC